MPEATVPADADFDLSKFRALTPRERTRLVGILTRLTSTHSGERAAAGLLAGAFLARHGLTWADLTTLLLPSANASAASDPLPGPDRRRRGGRPWRGYCRRRLVRLGQALDCLG